MYPYRAPLDEMQFVLNGLFDAPAIWQQLPELAGNIDEETAAAILAEAARLNEEVVYPLNRPGDEQGVRFEQGIVFTPDGYRDAYQAFVDGGWIGLCGDPDFGGMGMPKMLGVLVDEMGYGACNAFTLYNSLTAGAALCINAHGSDELKARYLPMLYSGQWAGAMDMTEAQAGSDLRHIRTRAEPQADGSYRITGTKIFITGGDHDLAENIIHLVLAKLPQASGLSLFVVPKLTLDDAGMPTQANGVTPGAVEHKMGLKGSATCVMNFDGATGYLLGKPNRGLVCMFTMMNYERLAIGLQGLGSAEAARQMAGSYAKERQQGQAAGHKSSGADAIVVHGDVRRMLLTINALTDSGRALAVHTALQLDVAKYSQDSEQQAMAVNFAGLLTPVAKAFLSDRGLDMTVMAQQVFGGHGYIRETGIEQLVRDTRIAQIYEGTNGIQAIDFLGRKVVGDNVETLGAFITELNNRLAACADQEQAELVHHCFSDILAVAHDLNREKLTSPALINACAVDFLDAFGYALCGYYSVVMADIAKGDNQIPAELRQRKTHLCQFYLDKLLPRVDSLLAQVKAGERSIMAMPEVLF